MNAAFVLVTTAWLAGADAAPAHTKAAAPAASHDCCNECCRPRLLDKLKAMLQRCDDCCEPAKPKDCCGHHKIVHKGCCNDCCNECGFGARLKAKLHSLMHRDCCDSCCDSAPAKAEPIKAPKGGDAPKKMPDAPAKSVQVLRPTPAVAPAGNVIIIQE